MAAATTVAKAAAFAVRNKDSLGKCACIAAAAVFAPVFMLIALYLYAMSAFSGDGVLRSPEYFEGTDSGISQALDQASEPYYEQIRQSMIDRRKEILKEHTYEREVVGEDGKKRIETETPHVTRRIHYVSQGVMIAYLVMTQGNEFDPMTLTADMVSDLLSSICYVEETDLGENNFLLEHCVLTEQEIADLYFYDDFEKNQFLFLCNAYDDYFDAPKSYAATDEEEEKEERTYLPGSSQVPLYLQYDAAWGGLPYGNGTIKRNGCCPTCLAMVLSALTQRSVLPDQVVAWSGNRYYVNGEGTSWNIFSPAAAQWGVRCTNIGKNVDAMTEALQSGKLIIASMGPGTFTKGGHFIVLTGITADGGILVNDPNDNNSKRHSMQTFAISLILRESKNMWVFEV